MGQAEYEAFKAKLREWMEAHPEEYAAFEESMNTRDMAGCQAVLLQAIALIPQYRKLTAAKANEGLFDHVDEIEQAAKDNDLARKLIGECEQPAVGSPVPAMLCWLYFGKSFERMVEHCEELRRSPDLGYFQKITMSATIRLLIARSIKLGFEPGRSGKPTAKPCVWPKAIRCWIGPWRSRRTTGTAQNASRGVREPPAL